MTPVNTKPCLGEETGLCAFRVSSIRAQDALASSLADRLKTQYKLAKMGADVALRIPATKTTVTVIAELDFADMMHPPPNFDSLARMQIVTKACLVVNQNLQLPF
jgi:hypothetical protein